MDRKDTKTRRILDIYVRLLRGKVVNKAEEAARFGVDLRSIQRDIDDIRSFLSSYQSEWGEKQEVLYRRKERGFVMKGMESTFMSNAEIAAVSKILLDSRAFTQTELNIILDKLMKGCVSYRNMKLVSEWIANEKFHYVELNNRSCVTELLWELGSQIKEQHLLEISYKRQVAVNDVVTRVVQPVAIIFSEYYFYLNAYIVKQSENGEYERMYDYPAIFRIDRILSYKILAQHFQILYANRFEEREFRKRIQFMFAGELLRLKLKYHGISPEPVLDRLPTAKVVKKEDGCFIIEAQVYGKGILMWLLSQGRRVEILEPQSLREEMKAKLQEMLEMYG